MRCQTPTDSFLYRYKFLWFDLYLFVMDLTLRHTCLAFFRVHLSVRHPFIHFYSQMNRL